MGAAALVPSLVQAQCGNHINHTLRALACQLHKLNLVKKTELREVSQPTIGFVQWEWAHFHPAMEEKDLPIIERVNKALFKAMKAAHHLPGSHMDALYLEGVVDGREHSDIAKMQELHRTLVQDQLTFSVPFSASVYRPTRKEVEAEMENMSQLDQPMTQRVLSPWYRNGRWMTASPLARLGAGYALSRNAKVTVLPAEHEYLDRRAAWAELHGTKDEYQTHVIENRNAHFAKIIAESKKQIAHLLVGCGHNLVPEIDKRNNGICTGMSHLLISVDGIDDIKSRQQK